MFGEIPRKNHQNLTRIRWKLSKNRDFFRNSNKISKKFNEFLRVFWIRSGAKVCKSCRSWKMLKKRVFGCKNRLRYRRERALKSLIIFAAQKRTLLHRIFQLRLRPRPRRLRPRQRRLQGWKIRLSSDRIIRIFAHQNSLKILSELRQKPLNSLEILKI